MYCPKCGKEVNDDAVVCIHCGRSLKEEKPANPEHNESKTALGVIFGLFLGLIGLLIGICLYPDGTVARKTFIKAWVITFLSEFAVVVVIWVILLCTVLAIA